jgi:hypothetical protein
VQVVFVAGAHVWCDRMHHAYSRGGGLLEGTQMKPSPTVLTRFQPVKGQRLATVREKLPVDIKHIMSVYIKRFLFACVFNRESLNEHSVP